MKPLKFLLGFQTIYYLLTGLWPLVDINSFMLVTGPKTDIWLVKTVAVLLVAISFSFIACLYIREFPFPVFVLSVSAATGLLFIDCYYTFKSVISWIYLADAFIEIILIVLLIMYRGYKKDNKKI